MSTPTTPPPWFTAAQAAPSREGRAGAVGAEVHWVAWGSPESPPVVLVHPGRGTVEWWRAIGPALGAQFHAIALDLTGHGRSAFRPRGDYDLDRYADDIAAVIDEVAQRRAVLCGNSLGGYASIAAAERFPERISGVLLADVPVWTGEALEARADAARARTRRRPAKLRVYPTLDAALARFKLGPPQPDPAPYILEHVARSFVREVEGGWVWHFDPNAFVAPWPLTVPERLARLTVPYVVVRGEHSALVSAEMAERMASATGRRMPIEVLSDAYHHIGLDNPLGLTELIVRYADRWHAG